MVGILNLLIVFLTTYSFARGCDYKVSFECISGNCIHRRYVCDGDNDCGDGEDEKNCADWHCDSSELQCKSYRRCIPKEWFCNGEDNCKDGSDEDEKVCDPCSQLACSQKCETTTQGARCYCNDGFELDVGDNETCIDINECLVTNVCSQICLNTVGSYTCACHDGYQLINGTCIKFGVEDSEFIFFKEGSNVYIKKRKAGHEILDVLPLPSLMGRITGLSFQPKTQVLYIADGEGPGIYAANISSSQVRDLVSNHLSSPEDIAYDWMSNNLYWVDSDKGTAEVISVDTLKRIVLIEELSKPISLALSPCSGIMFIAEVGFEAWISMFEMDGTNKRILHSVQGLPMSLTLHPSKTLLYWSDTREEIISYVNYTNTSPPRTLKRVAGIMSVAASEDRVFFTTEEMQQKRKPTARVQEVKLLEYEKGTNWKSIIYSYGMKPSRKSECLIENGGCDYLCLTSPKGRTCACSSAMKLDEDGRKCVGKICEVNYFKCADGHCVPAGMKCDGNIDCNDGSDERNCEEHTSTLSEYDTSDIPLQTLPST